MYHLSVYVPPNRILAPLGNDIDKARERIAKYHQEHRPCAPILLMKSNFIIDFFTGYWASEIHHDEVPERV